MTANKTAVTPAQIGRYRVTGELGRGGMGMVYRGEDRLIGREVAIKTLFETTPELRERFYLEARSGILSHPNIVTVYELGEHEGSPFIAMELIEGESLEKVLRGRKRLPLLEALSIVEQLCAGLGHAHGHGVVHRDVKPANVLIRPDGRLSIVDFGIARLADQTRHLTRTDALLGTFHYIAPERLKGEASDGRADVWSVGVMLYEMLTGELPFKGKDVSSLYRVIHEPYVPVTEYVQDLPEGLTALLDKALAKHVDDRYATAEEVFLDLQPLGELLKRDRVDALLGSAQRLAGEQQFAGARNLLLQVQRLEPGNANAKLLIQEVQERLSRLQRDDQLRQTMEQGREAAGERRWDDAVLFFQQAAKLDPESAAEIAEQIEQVHGHKRQQQQVLALWEQAKEARSRGDLTEAGNCLSRALEIDERNTDLRNAHAVLLREMERRRRSSQVEDLVRGARESYDTRQYTEALTRLREAAEIDPARTEVQQLLFTVATRQKEERRRHLLERIALEIQESLDSEDFSLFEDRIARALETLPGEGMLLRLKVEGEQKKREFAVQEVVRRTMPQVQELFAEEPAKALQLLELGIAEAPENETLRQSRARVVAHLEEMQRAAAQAEALTQAHAALDTRRYAEAVRTLETAMAAHGSTMDLDRLLAMVKDEQRKEEREAAELRHTEEIRAALESAVGAFEKAVAAGDLKRCMRALEEVANRNGSVSFVEEAIRKCEGRRQAAAEAVLRPALDEAHRLLRKSCFREASAVLRRADTSAFAGEPLRTEYLRFRTECAGAARANRRLRARRVSLAKAQNIKRYGAVLVVFCAVLLGLMLARFHRRAAAMGQQAAAVTLHVEQTDMEISAAPWATVLEVQNAQGGSIPLPNTDLTTPLRLENMAAGTYTITLVRAGGHRQSFRCRVSSMTHLCTAATAAMDVQRSLQGGQP